MTPTNLVWLSGCIPCCFASLVCLSNFSVSPRELPNTCQFSCSRASDLVSVLGKRAQLENVVVGGNPGSANWMPTPGVFSLDGMIHRRHPITWEILGDGGDNVRILLVAVVPKVVSQAESSHCGNREFLAGLPPSHSALCRSGFPGFWSQFGCLQREPCRCNGRRLFFWPRILQSTTC